ncbi:Uncharacterised protein [Klebsiella pneumoniae]|nr:Uncharacterised protein [Klebsiella pneumoniae]
MRFVNNDSVVLHQQAVLLDLRQQDPVGHQLDHRVITYVIAETHFVTDATARLRFQLFRNTVRHRSCRQATRLGMTDQPFNTAPQLHTDFR